MLIVDNKNININAGILNDDLLFIPIYIFSFISNTKLESEKNDLQNDSIENYIKSRSCSETFYDIQKIMKRGEHIGDFQIVNDDELIIDQTQVNEEEENINNENNIINQENKEFIKGNLHFEANLKKN